MTRRLYINEDNASFYDYRSHEEMSVAGLESLVDTYAAGGTVAGVFFCVNVQRALFDSRTWEPLWAGYDPQGPDDQKMFQFIAPENRAFVPGKRGRWWVHNLWLLAQRGIDHPQVWLDRCRHHGMEGWLTMRMNDCHHNPHPEAFWHSTFWRENPQLHRAAYRDEGWFETAFDYGQPAVVDYHLALLKELTERYDPTGIELDWMRWVKHFRPGQEAEGRAVLTKLMREARRLTEAAAQRLGHLVQLGVRLPTQLQGAWALGYDVFTWAQEGLVDRVVLAPFLEQACFEFEIAAWRSIFGPKVTILAQTDAAMHTWPNGGKAAKVYDYGLLFGGAAAALQEGADGVYLFNECYRVNEAREGRTDRAALLADMLGRCGDPAALREFPRRQAVSYHQSPGPGLGIGAALPIPLSRPDSAYDMGRFRDTITLRLPMGEVPQVAPVRLRLGFDVAPRVLARPVASGEFKVWLNAHPLVVSPPVATPPEANLPAIAASCLVVPLRREDCLDGVNIVEVTPPPGVAGNLVWAEIVVG